MGISIPSEAEYDERRDSSDFSLFPADDYVVEVSDVTIQPNKVDIFYKPKEGEGPRLYDGLEVRFRPISFANGDELVDEDGNDIPPTRNPLFFDWFDPARVGLKPQPAKARKFFAYAMGKELEDRIDIEDFQELVGKRLLATVIVKQKEGKPRRNNITDYRLIRQRRRAAAVAAEKPVVEEAAKTEVFGGNDDDLPF